LHNLFYNAEQYEARYGYGFLNNQQLIALFLSNNPVQDIVHPTNQLEFIGQEEVQGDLCDGVKLTGDSLDFEFWVETGEPRLLRKIVTHYERHFEKMSEDHPHLKNAQQTVTLTFQNWERNPQLEKNDFTFQPPDTMKKVDDFMEGVEGFGMKTSKSNQKNPNKLEGQPAPNLQMNLLNGEAFDLSKEKGKRAVVLGFWSEGSVACRILIPRLDQVAQEFDNNQVRFVAVNQADQKEDVENYVTSNNLQMDVAIDRSMQSQSNFFAYSENVPQTVFINKNGIVQSVHLGLMTEQQIREEVRELVQ